MFLKSFRCPALGKCNELSRTPDHLSLTNAREEDPKRAQNLPLHAYELTSRSGVSQKIPINFVVKFCELYHLSHSDARP